MTTATALATAIRHNSVHYHGPTATDARAVRRIKVFAMKVAVLAWPLYFKPE